MNITIRLILATVALASSLAADVIRKPGIYRPKGVTTTLRITDGEVAVANFAFVAADGRKTQVEAILGETGTWACLLEGEWTVWIYQEGKSSVRAITILPPEDGALQFRTSNRKVSIVDENEAIPAELRSIIK